LYALKVADVLRAYSKVDGALPRTGNALHEWQRLETSLAAWLRK